MIHYPHYVADFNNATRHLTRTERSVYRDLIDLYYETEMPLIKDSAKLCRLIIARSNEEATAVEQVLNEFFNETAQGWFHGRCEEEIDKFHANNSQKSAAGKASAAARALKKQQTIVRLNNVCSTSVESPYNGTPTNQNQNQIKPPIPPEGDKPNRKRSAVSLKTFLDECKTKGEQPIPETSAAIVYANEVGIPSDFLWLQWREFLDRYKMPDAKRYKDWRIVFHKSVRGNWFKLWYLKDDQYVLSTTGLQAKKLHGDKAA